ncbi:septation protein SepH [Arthrobacter cryoconiti]|uniref:Septation protein SepH n=1 Tax=Arthrobacter cryoconiti TaxID=748907 RepID=A0ABV8R3V5_9MICC|nr:septation protein SepH [Arthrobacter cryoconiti]MCC9069051.1 DUF3071 domain-containing protein [Arthrobacter cryoconiti]
MTDLRLVGVHEDGEHLLLSGTGGEIFSLPIDEALRLATIRSPHRPSQSTGTGIRLSPREIQAQIRSGASASDVAEHAGLSLEQVRRYEGPVLAEREHVAQLARKVIVAPAATGRDGYLSVFGDSPVSLGEMVMHRLNAFGIDTSTLRWDAWRVHDGSWTVTADFEPGTDRPASSIGEPAPARWTFHTGRKTLFNANRWAQQLSELEPLDGPVPERRLSAVVDRPFDVEADTPQENSSGKDTDVASAAETPGGVVSDGEAPAADAKYPGNGLLDMLRSKRGQRLGLDEDGDDELAAMLGGQPEAMGKNETETSSLLDDDSSHNAAEDSPAARGKKHLRAIPFLTLAPSVHGEGEPPVVGVGEVSPTTREITVSGAPSVRHPASGQQTSTGNIGLSQSGNNGQPTLPKLGIDGSAGEQQDQSDIEVAARLERKATAKPKRSSVPSWDEIVFGTKGD